MASLRKLALRSVLTLAGLVAFAFWFVFLSPRPPLKIDPATLVGDGSTIDYCELPVLDGRAKTAADIPKGNTSGCSYQHFSLPILRECTEPLTAGVADIRGLWRGVGGRAGHVERIEQCGTRTVVTSGGLTTNDTEGAVLFTLGDREYCARTSAGMYWNDGVLDFRVFGWGPVVVRRYPDGEHLV